MEEGFLAQVVGHDETREVLRRLYASERIPNGLLLLGEEGIGKRTLALAFAGVLVAGDRTGSIDPRSPAAKKLEKGIHGDLELVERAEEQRLIGIERIRHLKETFSLTPVEAVRRVAVVIDADRLTEEAGNALLKLLEEPPPRSHLVLTARDRDAVMLTLLSRCRVLAMRALPSKDVERFLEHRGVSAHRRQLLALLAEGRPGLAFRLAEQKFDEIGLGEVARLLNASGSVTSIAEEIAAAARQGSEALEGAREQLRPLIAATGWVLRQALRSTLGASAGKAALAALPEDLREALLAKAPAEHERGLAEVLSALADIDRNLNPELVLYQLCAVVAGR